MRRDALLLADIVEAADYIAGFLAGFDLDQFRASELLRSAVAQKRGPKACGPAGA